MWWLKGNTGTIPNSAQGFLIAGSYKFIKYIYRLFSLYTINTDNYRRRFVDRNIYEALKNKFKGTYTCLSG